MRTISWLPQILSQDDPQQDDSEHLGFLTINGHAWTSPTNAAEHVVLLMNAHSSVYIMLRQMALPATPFYNPASTPDAESRAPPVDQSAHLWLAEAARYPPEISYRQSAVAVGCWQRIMGCML